MLKHPEEVNDGGKNPDSNIIILGTKDGTRSMFVNPNKIESVFLPFVEGEAKEKPKE
jgi:hypothetical protein